MLKSYLTTAWRNIRKNKVFSFINVIGLAIGMAACLLILQYVNFELSYDQFNKNVGDLYRVYNDRYQNGKLIQHGTITYSAIGKAMQDDFPEVVAHTRVEPFGPLVITEGIRQIGKQRALYVDNAFLSMFSYPLMAGDGRAALEEPHTAVLTEDAVKRYYGATDPGSVIGRTLVVGDDSIPYRVTAVIRDVPENSHLQYDLLLSYLTLYSGKNAWLDANYDFVDSDFWHYIQLRHGTDPKALEAKFEGFSGRHFQGNKISGSVEKFHLQPLARAHLYSDFEYEIGKTGSATVVWGLLIIASFIIVIAWVNYINLSTARSVERAKEVGVRKVIGAARGQLVRQFLTESFLINLMALLVGVGSMFLLQPLFNDLVGHRLSASYLLIRSMGGYGLTIGLLGLLVLGIFVSAYYPAFVLSSFRPILVLKGRFSASKRGIALRKALVIGQFGITVALMIGSFVVFRQIRYMDRQQLGVNINQVLVISAPALTNQDSTFMEKENSFFERVKRVPGVEGVAASWSAIGGETGRTFNVRRDDQDSTVRFTMRQNGISEGWLKLYQVKLVAGRGYTYTDYDPDFGARHNIVINESAAKLLGYRSPEDAIGKTIIRWGRKWVVIGVIGDYHQKSLRYAMEPTLLMPFYGSGSDISVRIATQNVPAVVEALKKQYEAYFPGNLFDFYFLDQHYNSQYANDQLFGKAFSIFAGFAIFIACLGLLGLTLFATAQRTKEIGVRKVLGASVTNIVALLSKDFLLLVGIAFVVASPVAWWVMHRWLQDFAYRIEIEWWVFVLAGVLAAVIALATISMQAVRAAVANPVKSLRME
ncbi:MAG TPA: ABC transporter permease [Puia sp.]|jgi:putative ABC transport system permease protein|nr:ABC transporter permease [Puia sp.]